MSIIFIIAGGILVLMFLVITIFTLVENKLIAPLTERIELLELANRAHKFIYRQTGYINE